MTMNSERKIQEIATLLGIDGERARIALGIYSASYMKVMEALQSVSTYDQADDVWRSTKDGSEEERLALRKAISLCSTAHDAMDIFNYAHSGTPEEKLAWEKWDELSFVEVRDADSYGAVKWAYNRAPDCGKARDLAFQRLLVMSTSLDQVLEVYRAAPHLGEVETLAIHRLAELLPD